MSRELAAYRAGAVELEWASPNGAVVEGGTWAVHRLLEAKKSEWWLDPYTDDCSADSMGRPASPDSPGLVAFGTSDSLDFACSSAGVPDLALVAKMSPSWGATIVAGVAAMARIDGPDSSES